MFRKLLTVDCRFLTLSSWLTTLSSSLPVHGLRCRHPCRASPPASPQAPDQVSQVHAHLTSSADPALEFESKATVPCFRAMVCWSLNFDFPMSTSVFGDLPYLYPSSDPNTKLEPQALPLTQERRLSLAENPPWAGTLPVSFSTTSSVCWTVPVGHSRHLLSISWMNGWMSHMRRSQSIS